MPNSNLLGKMIAIKNAAIEVDIATSMLKPFTGSANETLRASDGGVLNAFELIANHLRSNEPCTSVLMRRNRRTIWRATAHR